MAGIMEKICKRCGKSFIGSPKRKYCSRICSCRNIAHLGGYGTAGSKNGQYKHGKRINNNTNPITNKCYHQFKYALGSGKIEKLPCEICGKVEGRIEAHHKDYSKPLEVIWLCRKHHYQMHKKSAGVATR